MIENSKNKCRKGERFLPLLVIVAFFMISATKLSSNYFNAKEREIPSPKIIYGKKHPLVGINDAAIKDSLLIVVTNAFPAIHLFKGNDYKSWGKKGNGPSELKSPSAVEISGDTVYVLDFRPGACKIVSYNLKGQYQTSIPVPRQKLCYKFEMGNGNKFVELGQFKSRFKTIMQLSSKPHSLIKLKYHPSAKLKISGGPMRSFNIQKPFEPAPAWDVNNKGELIVWQANNRWLLIRHHHSVKKYIKISKNNIKVPPEAFNRWLDLQYPSGKTLFGRSYFYKNVRSEIRDHIATPKYYPLMSDIVTDPLQNIWLLRAYYRDNGQVWLHISKDKKIKKTVNFPPGVAILAFGKEFIVAKSKDKNGNEYIELYNREDFV